LLKHFTTDILSDDQILVDPNALDSANAKQPSDQQCHGEEYSDELPSSEIESFDDVENFVFDESEPNFYPDESLPCSEIPSECVEELLWSEADPFNYGNDNDTENPGEVLQSEVEVDHESPEKLNHHEALPDQPPLYDSPHYEEGITDNTPLYPGASITVNVTMILLLAFVTRHKLTNEALSDLLYLIDTICPQPNNCCKTLHYFRKYFSYLLIPTKFCYYCSNCYNPISNLTVKLCDICKRSFKSVKDFSYFLHISVSSQIKSFFARKSFLSHLQYRFSRKKTCESNYEDIYDGLLYKKEMTSNGILSSIHNLSLTWNVDGLPLFKSSKFSLWPMYFVINELPYKLRIRTENMIISGLWFGENKPNMNIYLLPIFRELLSLERKGVEVRSPSLPYSFVSRAIVLAGTCDLPAKSLILNTMQFNGKHGCGKCLDPGVTYHTSTRGHTHVYPYQATEPTGHGEKRSSDKHVIDAKKALQNNEVENGVKGSSWLMKLSHYDIIKGTSIDYMHCVLLGVTKLLLSLWFNTKNKASAFYLGRKISMVDERLVGIHPPSVITRKPRKLSEHLKYYKASEYRSFLLYYSLPVLHGILPPDYWNHYSLLVISIYYLLQQSISEQQLLCCEQMLKQFCSQFERFYGMRHMTANLHNLLHLTDCVRELGPLWAYSCFHFEGQNGTLKSLIHGTQHIEKQIMISFAYKKNLPAAAEETIPHNSTYLRAFEHLHFDQRYFFSEQNCVQVGEDTFTLGKPQKDSLSEEETTALLDFSFYTHVVYSRILVHGIRIYSCYWNKACGKHSNSTIAYYDKFQTINYGIVQNIIVLKSNTNMVLNVLFTVSKLQPHTDCLSICTQHIPHIGTFFPPSNASELVVVTVDKICSLCVYMSFKDVENKVFVAVLANLLEKD